MPFRPARRCTYPSCGQRLVGLAGDRCSKHQNEFDRVVKKEMPWRSYGRGWTGIRNRVMAEEPVCGCQGCRRCMPAGRCARSSAEVDHILSRRRGGSHDRANLQALCGPCHAIKTVEDSRGGTTRTIRAQAEARLPASGRRRNGRATGREAAVRRPA